MLKNFSSNRFIFYQPDEDIVYLNVRYRNGELDVVFLGLDVPFCTAEISKACKQLNSWKSAGPDYLLNDFLSMTLVVNILYRLALESAWDTIFVLHELISRTC